MSAPHPMMTSVNKLSDEHIHPAKAATSPSDPRRTPPPALSADPSCSERDEAARSPSARPETAGLPGSWLVLVDKPFYPSPAASSPAPCLIPGQPLDTRPNLLT
jgi:hypothetical protein